MANFTFNSNTMLELANLNLSANLSGVPVVAGSIWKDNEVLTIEPLSGYIIVQAWFNYQDPMFGHTVENSFDIAPDGFSATILRTTSWPSYGYFEAVTEAYTPEVSGTNRIYKITHDEFNQVNAMRFQPRGGVVIDYGDYILGLIELPFSPDESYVSVPENVRLGDIDTGVESETLTVDRLPVSLGKIEVPATHGNLLDFNATVCNLHLPNTTPILVDPDYVIGEVLEIEYIIDVYSGNATINLSSSKVDGQVFYSKETSLGISIPYMRTGNSANLDNNNINVGGENHIRTPFIEVIRKDAILPNGFFNVPILDDGVLNGKTGYVVVNEIELKVPALLNEVETIYRKLSQGVIIQ